MKRNVYLECIKSVAKSKGVSLEQFVNMSQEKSYSFKNSGIYGTSALGLSSIERGGNRYVPGLEVMTGFNYNDREIKSGRDRVVKDQFKVPNAPVGWWVSEKFDGQRAVWDGEKFISRGGSGDPRVYPYIPRWFTALMPPGIALDGELFMARNSFSATTSILKTKLKPESERKSKDPSQEELDIRWMNIKYIVFDVINDFIYEKRKEMLKEIVKEREKVWKEMSIPFYLTKGPSPLVFTEQFKITSEKQLIELYNKLVSEDAEGVMIRAPGIPYIPRRTKLMLKMKLEEDSECRIIGYKPGEGKYKSLLGSFYCKDLVSGNNFYIGGMDDNIRKNYLSTHPIGTVISYQFNGKTADNIPRHPRYKGIRPEFN